MEYLHAAQHFSQHPAWAMPSFEEEEVHLTSCAAQVEYTMYKDAAGMPVDDTHPEATAVRHGPGSASREQHAEYHALLSSCICPPLSLTGAAMSGPGA